MQKKKSFVLNLADRVFYYTQNTQIVLQGCFSLKKINTMRFLSFYRDKMSGTLISGNKPLRDRNSYIKELNKIGLEKYLEVT